VLRKRGQTDDNERTQPATEIIIRAKEAIVYNVKGIGGLQVFDMQGRLISHQLYDGAVQAKAFLGQGVNLLHVQLFDGQGQTFKFFVP